MAKKRSKSPPRRRRGPPPAGMSQAQYARHRRVTRGAVSRAVQAGRIPFIEGTRRIDARRADREWKLNTDPLRSDARRPRASKAKSQGPKKGERLYEARARREIANADRAELDLAQARAELVSRAKVREAATRTARGARDVLFAVPDQVTSLILGKTDYFEVHGILTAEIRKVAALISDEKVDVT